MKMVGKLPELKAAKFKYVGSEPSVDVFGYTFKRGEVVEVNNQTYLGQQALEKLPNNQQFEAA